MPQDHRLNGTKPKLSDRFLPDVDFVERLPAALRQQSLGSLNARSYEIMGHLVYSYSASFEEKDGTYTATSLPANGDISIPQLHEFQYYMGAAMAWSRSPDRETDSLIVALRACSYISRDEVALMEQAANPEQAPSENKALTTLDQVLKSFGFVPQGTASPKIDGEKQGAKIVSWSIRLSIS